MRERFAFRDSISLAGWLFMDLTLGLAMLFFAINTVGRPKEAVNPTPELSSLQPPSAYAGSGDLALTAIGSGFVPGARLRWNDSERPTSVTSAAHLTATISAEDIKTVGSARVTIFNPAPGGGVSAVVAFDVLPPPPVPVIDSLTPNSVLRGGPGLLLTINGRGYGPNSVVQWNGQARSTNYSSPTVLTAGIAGSDIAREGSAVVTVFTPAPGGGTSNPVTFSIEAPLRVCVPVISPDVIQFTMRADTNGLIAPQSAGYQAARNEFLANFRGRFNDLVGARGLAPETARAGVILTFGTSPDNNRGRGPTVAAAVNSILRTEPTFSQVVQRDYLQFVRSDLSLDDIEFTIFLYVDQCN